MRNDCLNPAINKRAAHFQRKRRVAEAFLQAGEFEIAQHLRDCQETSRQCICTCCGHVFYIEDRCRQRTCPLCSYSSSIKRAEWIKRMLHGMKFPKLLTLTIRRTKDDPRDVIDRLRGLFNELREDACFAKVKGGCYQIELKWRGDGWHVHMHVMMDCPFMPRQLIYSAWRRITGQDVVNIDIKAATTDAEIAYVAKYAAKSADYEGDIPQVVAWWKATKGKRLFAGFGEWYHKEPPEAEDDENSFEPHFLCPSCGREGTCCAGERVRFVVGPGAAREFEKQLSGAGPPRLDIW